jgi:hypothetical protein
MYRRSYTSASKCAATTLRNSFIHELIKFALNESYCFDNTLVSAIQFTRMNARIMYICSPNTSLQISLMKLLNYIYIIVRYTPLLSVLLTVYFGFVWNVSHVPPLRQRIFPLAQRFPNLGVPRGLLVLWRVCLYEGHLFWTKYGHKIK